MKRLIKKIIKKDSYWYKEGQIIYRKAKEILHPIPKQKKMMKIMMKYYGKRFSTFSGCEHKSFRRDTAYLTWLYHVIEKGLTMPEFRFGFGQEKVMELCQLVKTYSEQYGRTDRAYITAIAVLMEYKRCHELEGYNLPEKLSQELATIEVNYNKGYELQNDSFTFQEFYKDTKKDFAVFAKSRHSIRNFRVDQDIPVENIVRAIELATTAPSACNRQAARVHIVQGDKIKQCMALQNGNRGFGHLVNKLLVVTGDLQTVLGAQEFFDLNTNVGIFIMNLSYSLHYYEIAHCILNWYALPKDDIKLRRILEIPNQENVVAFIACGKAPEEFKVAVSPRMSASQYYTIHE